VIHDLGTLGGSDAVALYVDDLGKIVGESTRPAPFRPSLSCGESPLTQHGFFWENGKVVDLDTLGGKLHVCLRSKQSRADRSAIYARGGQHVHPFLWQKGTMKDLGALGGDYGYAGTPSASLRHVVAGNLA